MTTPDRCRCLQPNCASRSLLTASTSDGSSCEVPQRSRSIRDAATGEAFEDSDDDDSSSDDSVSSESDGDSVGLVVERSARSKPTRRC